MVRFALVSVLVVSAAAWAQSAPRDDDDEPAAADKAAHDDKAAADDNGKGNVNLTEKGGAEGGYKGVAPGAQALPPHPPKLPVKKGPQRMTWSGFQVKDGVPTVFVELTAAPEYHVEDAPGEVVVTLKNTVVPLRNNRRPLEVAAFDTPVKEVSTQPKGKDVRVTIKTKGNERPAHHERVEDAAGGFRMLVIELPNK